MRAYLLRAGVAGLLIAGCSAPVCPPQLVEQGARCVVIEPQCEPACSPTAHEVCDGNAESPSCVCAPGYSGVPCTWTGILVDPGFENKDNQDAWTGTEGAGVLQNREDTPVDPGLARIERSAACNAGAVSQTVQMPSYEVAEPLVAEVTYRAEGLFGLALGFNRAWALLPLTEDFAWTSEPERVCLGEAAYGGAVTVQLSTPDKHPSCFGEQQGEINVDRLEIVPAEPGECPAPGEALNAAGEEDGGWEFDTTGTAEAGLVEGVGRGGTSGIRIAREGTASAAASTKLSVPTSESLKSPALRFWWKGTSGSPFIFQLGRFDGVGLGAFPLDTVRGNGSDRNFVYCLPPWTHGRVVDLIFSFATGSSTELTELVVDDIEVISDESCGTSTDMLDPGFESGPNRISGVTIFPLFEAAATLRNEPSLARTGDGVLELSYSNESVNMWFETWVFAPESNGVNGPAVAFWSNVPAVNELSIQSVKGRAAVEPADLQVGGGWKRNEVCIFPEWSGRWFRLQLRLGDFSPRPDRPVDPPIRIYIDDLELTTSAACPSE